MIDTIKPMGMDLTKDLHGHVRVELRDRWTGRVVDSQEKDNLVTNAVQRLLLSGGWLSSSNQTINSLWTPVYSKALGGIMAFDSTLTESADNTGFPSSAKLKAYAGNSSNSEDPLGGSYNAEESGFTSTGHTAVWDFLTSQANGTIASIARTSHQIGSTIRAISDSTINRFTGGPLNDVATNAFVYGEDQTNGYLYFGLGSSATVGGVSLQASTIYKAKGSMSKVRILDGPCSVALWDVVKTLSASDGTTDARQWIYDPYGDVFLYRNGSTLHIVSTDGTHTTKTLTGTTGTIIAVTENYYFATSGSSNTVYRYSKSNVADAQTFTFASGMIYIFPLENDVITMSGSGAEGILYPDGTIINRLSTASLNSAQAKVGNLYSDAQGSYRPTLRAPAHYLGTIANLDSPITKTSSQTMKITYTLTEA